MKAMRAWWSLAWIVACASAVAQTAPPPSRGQLLYTTHCVACHDTQIHWRDQRLVTDWESLKQQVRQWQARVVLGWSDSDVAEVARHLNDTVYRFAQTSDRKS